jgi:PAS domain S-box-containing protein
MTQNNPSVSTDTIDRLPIEKYKDLFERMINAFAYHKIILDDNGKPIDYKFLEANKAFEKMTGLKKEEIIGKKVTEVLPNIKEDPTDWVSKYGDVALTGRELRMESYSEALKKWFLVYAYPPENGHFAVLFDDITKQKETEFYLQQIIRLYSVLSNVNQLVLKIREEQLLFQKVCEIIANDGKFALAWVGLLNPDGQIVPTAHYGISENYLESINININDEKTGNGPTGLAAKNGVHIVNDNFDTNPNVAQWKESAKIVGFKSSAAFPIKCFNKVIGVLNIYSYEPHFFNTEELKLLDELSADISFVIEFNRQEKELEETKNRWQFALENSDQGVWDWDLVTNKVFFSEQWKTIFGYSANEISDNEYEWENRVHPEDVVAAKTALNDCINGIIPIYINEHRLLKKDGTYVWVLGKGKVISKDAEGKATRIIGTNTDISLLKGKEMELKNANIKLLEQIEELEKMQKVLIDRETKMIELKGQIEKLENKDTQT